MKKIYALIFVSLLAFMGVFAFGNGKNDQGKAKIRVDFYPGEKVKSGIEFKAHPFRLSQVRLLDGPFKDAMERDRKFLLDLEPDRLLHMFRITAGLPSSAEPLGGWEKPDVELRGHTLGHFLSACALMFASSGDERLKSKADSLVAELAKCQKALARGGYLSAFPEEFFERAEAAKRVWAPYYTLHKIMAGLLDMFNYCGSEQALEVVKGMADWVKMRTDRLDEEHMQRMLYRTEQGGMNEVLSNLYAVTGNPEYLKLARRFDEKFYLDPLSQYQDRLKGLHVNSFIPNMIGTAREYELTGDRVLQNIATYFWEEVTGARSFATGGTSNGEIWGSDPYQLSRELGSNSHETCCTYNMLKLTRHLFSWNPDPRYADYYERALFNGILSTQNPKDGMVMYYVPMASGFYKTFMKPRDSFWCCTGTGMENHAKYGDSIYFHDEEGIFVNLFIASELSWPEKGIRLRQETGFPQEASTALVISAKKPVELALHIRIPCWVEHRGRVKINGKPLEASASSGSYLTLRQAWKEGDRIEVDLPMGLSLDRLPDNPNLAAIIYGPLVLAGELGTEGMAEDKVYGHYGPSGDPVPAPYFVVKGEDLNSWIRPLAGKPLTFQTVNAGRPKEVTLVPFCELFDQRYAIYWNIYTEEEWSAIRAFSRALQDGVVDSLKVGDSVSNEEHNVQSGTLRSGQDLGKNWISVTDWLSCEMKVLPDQPLSLQLIWWSEEKEPRFEILIDDVRITQKPPKIESRGDFSEVTYTIPAELTQGKKKVGVTIRGGRGKSSDRIFGCTMLKEK